jgi:hypothetical protein
MLEVLSVGKGDIKLTIDSNDPGEVNDARMIIEEMLAKGYGIFVETDNGLKRVKRFNPKRMSYVISELPEGESLPTGPPKPGTKPRKRTKAVEREIPVAGSKAKAIGRTAGG